MQKRLKKEDGFRVPERISSTRSNLRSAILPILAEDLGEITPDVIELRDSFKLAGMKILQFGFSGPDNPFLPHHHLENCVVYTGSHDNDTALGWYSTAPEKEKEFYRRYFGRSGDDFAGDLIRAAWSSVAAIAIAPLQDFLRLGTDARMNFPGKETGNWMWRMPETALSPELKAWLLDLNYLYPTIEIEKLQTRIHVNYWRGFFIYYMTAASQCHWNLTGGMQDIFPPG